MTNDLLLIVASAWAASGWALWHWLTRLQPLKRVDWIALPFVLVLWPLVALYAFAYMRGLKAGSR